MGSTARPILSPPVRRDLAWRHATETDLERISYTIDLSRWREPRDLSKRGARVLRFFAALHRCGRVGYVGTRASYAAIGAAISRATHEAASRSTVIRACDELRDQGYLDRDRGRGARARQVGPHEWIREPLAVLTLTDRARALWGSAPPSSHPSLPVSKCNGYALPEEPSVEGIPARDVVDASPSTSAAASVSTEEPASAGVEPRGVAARVEPRPSARPVAPLAQLADGEPVEVDEHAACQVGRSRFPSGTRPASRHLAVSAILSTLASLSRFAGREGAALVARAKAEIAGRSDGPPSGIAWDYWIAKWPELAREERFRWARAEILPALRSTRASTSPPRIAAARPPASPPPAARPPAPTSPPPRPPASPPGPPAAIAEGETDAGSPFGDVLARQLARLAAKTATTCRSSES
jgi:hypothetical protein